MRIAARVVPLALLAGALACASASTPPGGPETYDPPKILRMRPDTNATNVRAGALSFAFDKVISERPTGASNLAGLFLISPSYGEPSVSWHRNRISVAPKGGFRPNTTYRIRMLAGLTDLEGNVDSVPHEWVFSTGAVIAKGHIRGTIFDWQGEKPGALAVIEAFPIPTNKDSLRYLTLADSMGRFDLASLPVGEYVLRGIVDQNKNRILDPRELYDTMKVAVIDSARREILAYVHDTIGVGIQTVSLVDSLTIRVLLDRALDTTFVVDASHFTLRKRDSTLVPLARVISKRDFDREREEQAKTKAIQDSVQRAAKLDSARAKEAKADTAKAPTTPPPPTTRRALPTRRAQVDSAVRRLTGKDSTEKEKPPKPSIPAPVNEVYITLVAPLEPASSYRLKATDLRTLLKRTRTSERAFTTPKPKADSTKKNAGKDAKDAKDAKPADARARPDTSSADGVSAAWLRRLVR